MKILFVPLDDRPCSLQFVERLAGSAGVELLTPPLGMLGRFRTPGEPSALRQWVRDTQSQADLSIVSLDMLGFGGLVASRLPEPSYEQVVATLEAWRSIASQGPPVLAFQSVLRLAPTQTTAAEVEWAETLVRLSCLDAVHSPLAEEVRAQIPADLLAQYLATRERNHKLNRLACRWVEEGHLAGLLLGIDDSKTAGWNVQEVDRLERLGIPDVWIAPGTDESAHLLLCRAAAERREVRVLWAHPDLPHQLTRYEDRPLLALLEAQMRAADLRLSDTAKYVLYVHGYSGTQLEASEQSERQAPPVPSAPRLVIADVAYANGGDLSLQLPDDLWGYSGWNTAGNTVGTALAILSLTRLERPRQEFLLERLADDLLYQAEIRPLLAAELGHPGLLLTGAEEASSQHRAYQLLVPRLQEMAQRYAPELSMRANVSLPWSRLFEVAVQVHLESMGWGP